MGARRVERGDTRGTRNGVARRFDRSTGVITKIAKAAGLSFDRTATKAAVEARKVDLAAKRAQLAADMLDDGARLRAQLWEPAVVYSWHKGEYSEREVAEPTFGDKRRIAGAVKMLVNGSIDLERHDSGDEDAARSLREELVTGLGR